MDRSEELKAIAEFEARGKIKRIDNPLEVTAHNDEKNAKDFKEAQARSQRAKRAQRKSNTNRSKK